MSSIMKGIVDEGGTNPFQDGYMAWKAYLDGETKQRPHNPYPAGEGMHEWEMGAARAAEHLDWDQLDEDLRKWFKEKWVRFGPDGKIRGSCARGDDSEGKPKCLPQKKAHALGKKGRKYAASKKRREDPNPERRGKAKNVATKKKTNEEKCPHCGGELVSEELMNEKQDACYRKVKARYKVWPSAYASGALVQCRKKGAANWGNKSKKKNESSVMKGLVDESTNFVTENILTEGKILLEGRVVRKLWESAGQKIVEAQLTPQQIQQIFQAAEKGQTQAGGNRTIAGKGVDAASAVNRAWEDLKTKIQNTGPIQNMDAMYDKAAEAMKKSTGGDEGAMRHVQKYRDFAKKHPIAQSFLYAALIAAAGLSGAGLGGAAALGLLKMTDRLLQGDKFSSALYKGGVTGALAYGAARLGDLLREPAAPGQPVKVKLPDGQDIAVKPGDTLSQIAEKNNVSVQDLMNANKDILNPDALAAGQNIHVPNATGHATYQGGIGTAADTAAKVQSGEYASYKDALRAARSGIKGAGDQITNIPATQPTSSDIGLPYDKEEASQLHDIMWQQEQDAAAKAAKLKESVQLTKYQVFSIMEAAIMHQTALNEGLFDKIKGVASKVGQYAATKAHNVTTKITADKLLQAWKKAGSPTDSEKVKAVLKSAGVSDQVIASVMPVQAGIVGVTPRATAGNVTTTMKATTQPAAAPAQAAQPTSAIGQGVAKAPNANVNPELQKRLAARKAGKPVYAGGLEEGVIVSHDAKDPEVAILGGAGTMSLSRLKKKAQAEANMLANDLAKGAFKSAAYNIKQLENSLATIKAAEEEMEKKYFGEDSDMRYAAEKTPEINPYGGDKDIQHRGAISETPTDNPTGASGEGGWRTYKPKSAGQLSEKINPETLKKGFYKEKDMGEYLLIAAGDSVSRGVDDPPTLQIYAFLKDKNTGKRSSRIGKVDLKIAHGAYLQNNPNAEALVAAGAEVEPDFQRKGIATAMYQYAKELGNDLIASIDQSDDAQHFWAGMKSKGQATGSGEMKEDTAYAGGMGQGGNAGQSYRKFTPKSAGTFKEEEQLDEKCWDSHKQVGMKKKGDKMVPNCVPKESAIMKGVTGKRK